MIFVCKINNFELILKQKKMGQLEEIVHKQIEINHRVDKIESNVEELLKMINDIFVGVSHATKILGIGRNAIFQACKEGKLKYQTTAGGGKFLFSLKDLQQYRNDLKEKKISRAIAS